MEHYGTGLLSEGHGEILTVGRNVVLATAGTDTAAGGDPTIAPSSTRGGVFVSGF